MKRASVLLLCLFGTGNASAKVGTFDCGRPKAPTFQQAKAQCYYFKLPPQVGNEPTAYQAEERCLAFFRRVAEARELICHYQIDGMKYGFGLGEKPESNLTCSDNQLAGTSPQQEEARLRRAEYAEKLAAKLRELADERDRYFLAINRLHAVAGRTFLDEARGEEKAHMSSTVPSLFLAGLAQKSLDDFRYSSRLMTLALRWSAGEAKGSVTDPATAKRELAAIAELDSEYALKNETQAGHAEKEAESLLGKALKTHTVDRIASIAAEHPIEKLLERVAESELAHALPSLAHTASQVIVPRIAGAAVVLAYEAFEHGGHVDLPMLAAVGAGATGGFVVGAVAAVGEAAYRNQQAHLNAYREFAGHYLQTHNSATAFEVSQAFRAPHQASQSGQKPEPASHEE